MDAIAATGADAIDVPAGPVDFAVALPEGAGGLAQLLDDEADSFAHVFEQQLEPAEIGKLSTVCRAFRSIAQGVWAGPFARAGSKLHLTMNEWEPHGKQGTKDVLNKYKKIKLKPRMVVTRDIPVDLAKPDGPTFRGRVDVKWGSALNTEGSAVRVDLMCANTSIVREKLVGYQPFFRMGKKDAMEIAPLDFHLGNTLSRHDSPFGLYQLRVRMDAYVYRNADTNTSGTYRTYEYTTPAFHIAGPSGIPKPNSARQKELLEGGGKRSRFS